MQKSNGISDLRSNRQTGASGGSIFSGPASETNGQISPDGKWVAYASNETGDWEIYVTTFPAAAGKWQVSRGGGAEPRWRGDGKAISISAQADAHRGRRQHARNFLDRLTARCFPSTRGRKSRPPTYSPTTSLETASASWSISTLSRNRPRRW